MTWKQVFTSSVGKKLTMALTGTFLIVFLVVHAGINACIWATLVIPDDHGRMFNEAAHFMGSTVLIRILEIGLFVFFFIHIIQGLMLELNNRKKRGTPYAVNYGNAGSKWYSRSMGLLGTLILIFLIVHWVQFWIPSRFTGVEEVTYAGDKGPIHDLFALMQITFSELWVVILYVLACVSLGYHLAHGFQSAFKTLGVHNRKYHTMLTAVGLGFSVIISVVFALMPISMYLKLVH